VAQDDAPALRPEPLAHQDEHQGRHHVSVLGLPQRAGQIGQADAPKGQPQRDGADEQAEDPRDRLTQRRAPRRQGLVGALGAEDVEPAGISAIWAVPLQFWLASWPKTVQYG
jgi:hypothetical protein